MRQKDKTPLLMLVRTLLIGVAVLAAGSTPAPAQKQALVGFAGTVVDSAKNPLSNAEVSFPGLGLSKITNEKGIFRIEGVIPGVHRVQVKHIGYGQRDTTIVLSENQNLEWIVTLGRIVTLDSVVVKAPLDPLMAEFESNRARGFGRFLTRADLAKVDGVSLDNVMRSVSGVDIMRTNTGQNFITSKRAPMSRCNIQKPISDGGERGNGAIARQFALEAQAATDECLRRERLYYVPDEGEKRMGYRRACFPLVFVDGSLMNSGKPTMPFDIKAYATEQIEAVEWYEGPSSTPPKYSIHNGECGVLALHLRKKRD